MISQHQKGTLKLAGTIKNSGNVNFAGLQKGAIGTSIGGIFGGNDGNKTDSDKTKADCEGLIVANPSAVIINEGTVAFTGETVQKFYIGGIAAFINKYPIPDAVKIINTGDVVATGKCGAGFEGDCVVSGIIGAMKAPVEGAQCFCTIDAYKYQAQQGMLSGKARSAAVLYNNAKVGGSMVTKYDEEEDEYTTVSLKATDYFKYLYGGTTDWTGNETYDGCTLITNKNQIDYSVPVVPDAAE